MAIALTRWWTRAYTLGLPADLREARRAEIESDLWESLHDPDSPRPQILPRLAGGVLDDMSWRVTLLPDETRAVGLSITSGCLLLLAMWQWLARPAIAEAIIGSTWVYPLAESVHVLSITLFLGLNVMLDLRLLGVTLRRVPASELLAQTLPWTSFAGLLTLASGMVLFVGEADRFAGNLFFQIKVGALALAILNLLIFHVAVYSRVEEWSAQPTPPWAARVCAVVSLALWAIVLFVSRLIAYHWFGS
jgi:hypothetical protein